MQTTAKFEFDFSFAKLLLEPPRVEMMFEAKHEVVGIANDDDVTAPILHLLNSHLPALMLQQLLTTRAF